MKTYYVYMMSNYTNNVLYIGVTNDLVRRVAEHKAHVNDGFTAKYNCKKLVYFEDFENVEDAISREKQLKQWYRDWKNNLVAEMNPQWKDLAEEVGVDDEIIESVSDYYKSLKES